MIFVVYTANEVDNKILLKQSKDLTNKKYTFLERKTYNKSLSENKRGDIVTTDDKNKPLSRLKSNETLYIVGHGDRANPKLSDLSPKELADLVQAYGLNPRIKHLKISLVCCHSGHQINISTPSYAQQFYSALLNEIHEIHRHHMDKENSLLRVKAPKHVIGFGLFGKAVGLKPEQYQEYDKIKKQSPSQLDEWLHQNKSELSKTDFNYF